ncbi:hypothetical protein FRB94_012886 [Tulasnella sp. JGI-2019a]|nr:hypothetical protein FRB94_012886 [Tulasnella sp. JGI-2019a]KAG9031964.1 hypothetical protein FRB95_002045 [Tulasnella sp. JGI-2019a]
MRGFSLFAAAAAVLPLISKVAATVTWNQVKIGGGGGFIPGIVFSTKTKGVAYARADIGGLYKLNSDDSWTPLLDWVGNSNWHNWGVDALALDPTNALQLYVAVGMYTIDWDPNNGSILSSSDGGSTWTTYALPFKVGGNMPGRGIGERLAVDPNLPSILYFGARSGNGLYKSVNSGATWTKVTAFPSVGTYVQDASNAYTADPIGLAWVTFDASSSSSGAATKRIFVGVANVNSTSVYVSTDAGVTWGAVAGQPLVNNLPHKGVISPSEKLLYITYNNNGGPYDGTTGSVYKYNITSGVWTDITPVSGSNLYFGFGGLAVDLLKPGTIMVSSVNSWWPDGQIFRSTDSGATWSPIWAWTSYPNLDFYYSYDTSLAPWIGSISPQPPTAKQVGWMMEALVIDPFDSNHWLYGTGLTIFGGHDLLNWDSVHNVTLKSLADGIEEDSVTGLISPPVGANLISVVGDNDGYVHTSLTTAPTTPFTGVQWATSQDIDYAGASPTNLVRVGTDSTDTVIQIAISTDSGASWNYYYGATAAIYGGKVAYSASATTILWASTSNGLVVSKYTSAFAAVSGVPSTTTVIASDKVVDALFYAANGNTFYVSTNSGTTFAATAGTLGSSTTPVKIAVNPTVAGDVWVSSDTGLYHTLNNGTSFTAVAGFTATWSISIGAPKTTGAYPSVYAVGTLSGTVGYWRSDDEGVSWTRLDDATHAFAAASSNVICGDRRVWGRVYVGTNGRGIFYGQDSGSGTATTVTTSSTSTVKTTSTTSTSTTSSKATTSTTSTTSSKATTTTTSSSSTTTKATTTSTSSASTTSLAAGYAQCGGSSWTGPTTCVSGFVCTYQNAFYSQCTVS